MRNEPEDHVCAPHGSRGAVVVAAVGLLGLLSGCASMPEVTYKYYPAKSQSTVTVTQTVDCNTAKTAVTVVNSAAITTLYSADYSQPPRTIALKKLNGALADSDVTINFFDDGRLKSINGYATGQGETILKSAINALGAVAALGGATRSTEAAAVLQECTDLSTLGAGKPVTLSYALDFDPAVLGAAPQALKILPASDPIYQRLKNQLPRMQVSSSGVARVGQRALYAPTTGAAATDLQLVKLQQMGSATLNVLSQGQSFFEAHVLVPLKDTYDVPLPQAALFGKVSYSLTLTEAGALSSIEYGKLAGAASGANVISAAATALAPPSSVTQAADVKAQADLIAQQQRLARCQAQPDKCQ